MAGLGGRMLWGRQTERLWTHTSDRFGQIWLKTVSPGGGGGHIILKHNELGVTA
jgi:hypothetical protein